MKARLTLILLLNILLASCAAGLRKNSEEPFFRVTIKDPSDQIVIETAEQGIIIDVTSPNGIGSAKFELTSGTMPAEIIIRLHLKGLEEFRLVSPQTTIAASIPSGVFKNSDQRIISPDGEAPISMLHPMWLDINAVTSQTEPTIPLEEGFFEIKVPKTFISKTGDSFEIQWIDFYR
ncbi:MAG TPA: hypothetical protein VNK49_08660 [Anaerolineales bacterium]|nr:hypothetical protein [Anaerolineales bacterium]